jgi:hypothetical protein
MIAMTTRLADRDRYLARPGRRAVVAADLTRLHGPTSGVVELPRRLFWYPDRRFDLDDPAYLKWMYQTVLCEAITTRELETWLDGETLVTFWPQLHLPRGVRAAWQDRHPELTP